jgi:hypothetical protein
MIPERLIQHQHFSFESYVGSLARTCIRRFRDAARLVEANLDHWPKLEKANSGRIYVYNLITFWERVCERYNRDVYDPQLILSLPGRELYHMAIEHVTEEAIFSQFVHWRLWPIIASENNCCRDVLRAIEALPTKDMKRTVSHLTDYVEDMEFSADICRPEPGYFE